MRWVALIVLSSTTLARKTCEREEREQPVCNVLLCNHYVPIFAIRVPGPCKNPGGVAPWGTPSNAVQAAQCSRVCCIIWSLTDTFNALNDRGAHTRAGNNSAFGSSSSSRQQAESCIAPALATTGCSTGRCPVVDLAAGRSYQPAGSAQPSIEVIGTEPGPARHKVPSTAGPGCCPGRQQGLGAALRWRLLPVCHPGCGRTDTISECVQQAAAAADAVPVPGMSW